MIALASNCDLDTAAKSHVDYLICANQFGHYEDSGNACYDNTAGGYAPHDRGTAAGYSYTVYRENISAGSEIL